MHRANQLFIAFVMVFAATVRAQEPPISLQDGAGREKVEAHCATCHSLDYIQMNSPFPDRKLWEAEVNKMINAFAAPIPKDEIGPIVEYLVKYYGKP